MSIFTKEPERVTVTVPAEQMLLPTQEYKRLAEQLGVKHTDDFRKKQVEFMKFLQDELIQIYPIGSVHRYMTKLAQKDRKEYVWKPARKQDASFTAGDFREFPDSYTDKNGDSIVFRAKIRTGLDSQYNLPIPYPVLLTMKNFDEHFGRDVVMLITDYETKPLVYPDPFLGIYHRPTRTFVIVEKWDEPSYRMEE